MSERHYGRMKRLFLALVLLGGVAQAQPPASPAPASQTPVSQAPASHPAQSTTFSATQRAEIVQILRDALRSDPSILRDAVTALQQDDARQQDAAALDVINSQHQALTENPADPSVGDSAADVTVVEFYDTRCPYCRRLLPTMAALVKADPKVRVVYKDLPILGANSMVEARALLAAQRQGGYERMQDVVMHNTGPATIQTLSAQAQAIGLDGTRLQKDMGDPAIQARLEANLQLAQALHVEGTPAFIIGTKLIPGAVSLAELQEAVAAARKR
jgi:protein-disulfide isomerase